MGSVIVLGMAAACALGVAWVLGSLMARSSTPARVAAPPALAEADQAPAEQERAQP
jgi:hypothetical protein